MYYIVLMKDYKQNINSQITFIYYIYKIYLIYNTMYFVI